MNEQVRKQFFDAKIKPELKKFDFNDLELQALEMHAIKDYNTIPTMNAAFNLFISVANSMSQHLLSIEKRG